MRSFACDLVSRAAVARLSGKWIQRETAARDPTQRHNLDGGIADYSAFSGWCSGDQTLAICEYS